MSARLNVLLLALTTFLAGANEYVLSGQLDLVAQGLGTSVEATGQLITVYALAYGLLVPIVSTITGRLSQRTTLVGAMVAYGLLTVAVPLVAGSLPLYLVLRVVQAIAGGLSVVTALSIAATIEGAARQGRNIATVIMGFTLSLIIAVPIGREVGLSLGWPAIFPMIGALALIAALCLRLTLPQQPPAATVALRDQVRLLASPRVAGGLLVTLLWMAGYTATYSYLTPYLIDSQHVPARWVSPILLAFGIASLIGTRLGGSITDKRGHHFTLVASKIAQAATLVLFAAAALLAGTASLIVVLIVLLAWAITAWAGGPSHQVRVAAIAPRTSGILVSLNQSSMQLGIAAGTGLGGLIVGGLGLGALPWVSAILVLAALLLMIALHHHQSRRESVSS